VIQVFTLDFQSIFEDGLNDHMAGASSATKYRGPWELIYYEVYVHQSDAKGREPYPKGGAGRRLLRFQLQHYLANFPVRSNQKRIPTGKAT